MVSESKGRGRTVHAGAMGRVQGGGSGSRILVPGVGRCRFICAPAAAEHCTEACVGPVEIASSSRCSYLSNLVTLVDFGFKLSLNPNLAAAGLSG